MKITAVTPDDFNAWLDLRHALWDYHTRAELETEMRVLYERRHQDYAFYIAWNNQSPVGLVEVSLRPHAPGCTTSPVGFIEGWYVRPEYRRQGVGRALIARAEDWARAQGVAEMGSDTNARYPVSPVAHAALGYEETNVPLHYRKSL